jgi:hypothetical protein
MMMPKRRMIVSMDEQQMSIMEDDRCLRRYAVSTATRGMGCTPDSLRTPVGAFRICEKIGADLPSGTIFKARVPVGQWQPGEAPDDDLVLTRILRLDGIEPANANTLERFIYIHGTNREDLLGQPASHGCVRLANRDMIEAFDLMDAGDLVEIQPLTRRRGRLLVVEFDEMPGCGGGLMELARRRGGEVVDLVSGLHAREGCRNMSDEEIRHALDIIRPDRTMCDETACDLATVFKADASGLIAAAQAGGWLVLLVTRGPLPLLRRTAEKPGILQIEGLPVMFDADGSYAGCGAGFTPTGRLDAGELVHDWMTALLPRQTCVLGMPPATGIPGVDLWIPFSDRSSIRRALAGTPDGMA